MDGMQRDYGPLLQETVQSHRRYTSLGQVASYIPELKKRKCIFCRLCPNGPLGGPV